MAMIGTTTIVVAARPSTRVLGLPQLIVARANTLRCGYSKKDRKALSALNPSPAVLKGMGLRQSSRPWGLRLVDERMDSEETRLRRLTMALNQEWILACVLGHIFFNPRRLQHHYDDHKSSSAGLPHPRVARAETMRCDYSKESRKALSALNLSPAVLKGMGLRRSPRPWGPGLVEERVRVDTEVRPLSRILNPDSILVCVLLHIFHPRYPRNREA